MLGGEYGSNLSERMDRPLASGRRRTISIHAEFPFITRFTVSAISLMVKLVASTTSRIIAGQLETGDTNRTYPDAGWGASGRRRIQ